MEEKVLPLQKHTSLICVLSGVITSLAYIFEELFALCWIGFIPLCIILFKKQTKKRVFTSLFCFFYAYYVVVYSFFVNLYPLDFAGVSNIMSVLVIAVAIVCIPLVHTVIMTVSCYVCHWLCNKNKTDALYPVAFAFSVMLGEYLQSQGSLGFPWARLFVTQIAFPVALQSASLFGSYFVTFLIVLFCAYIGYGLCFDKDSSKRRIYVSVAFAIMMVNIGFGAVSMAKPQTDKTINAVAIQGNLSSSEKWSGSVVDESIRRYENLAKTLENKDVDLIVTPETAFPVTLLDDGQILSYSAEKVNDFAKNMCSQTGANVVLGAFTKSIGDEYNSVVLYDKNGDILGTYQKRHLVPFGEFLPYRNVFETVLPALCDLNMLNTDITKGQSFEPIECDFGKVGFLICFDSIFSDSCRNQVKNGAQIITVSTNDSWYKESVALKQHCAHSVIRAIENGVSVIRSANTGISVIVSPKGEILSTVQTGIQGVAYATVPLLQNQTLYTKIGDVILCAGFAFIVLYATYKRRIK